MRRHYSTSIAIPAGNEQDPFTSEPCGHWDFKDSVRDTEIAVVQKKSDHSIGATKGEGPGLGYLNLWLFVRATRESGCFRIYVAQIEVWLERCTILRILG